MRLLTALLLLAAAPLSALSLWRHPEAAERNALFLDTGLAEISFEDGFSFRVSEFSFDFLPLSVGAYFRLPEPNLKSFGIRAAYHIDTGDPKTDIYFLYVFDCGFMRNEDLAYYGDEAQPLRLYDFRAGVRRLFGKVFCLVIETGYKLSGLRIGLSVKLN
jgi:hypothetical protein